MPGTEQDSNLEAGQQPVQSPPETAPAVSGLAQEDPKENDHPFYNVMPQGRQVGGVPSKPVISVKDTGPIPIGSSGSVFGEYKTLIIAILLLLVLGLAGYFGYSWYLESQVTQVPPLNTQTVANKSDGSPAASPEEISSEWMRQYFSKDSCDNESVCGNDADPDMDGLKNKEEYILKADPNNKDSDGDGIADGDEVYIFGSNPLEARTAGNASYNDADFLKGGYDVTKSDSLYTKEELETIRKKMDSLGLHEPTVTTLKDSLEKIYGFIQVTAEPVKNEENPESQQVEGASLDSSFDQTPEAKQDRDAQRYNTIKNLSIALVKYFDDNQTYPLTENFVEMVNAIKPYNRVATNPNDPVGKDPYVYAYKAENDGADFILSYYSETQNQLIRLRSKDAIKNKTAEEAKQYDDMRMMNLTSIQTALLIYSNAKITGNQEYVFPTEAKYKTELVPSYLSSIPKDPQTGKDYEYKVSSTFDSFTVKSMLSNPPTGYTGYMCNRDECVYY